MVAVAFKGRDFQFFKDIEEILPGFSVMECDGEVQSLCQEQLLGECFQLHIEVFSSVACVESDFADGDDAGVFGGVFECCLEFVDERGRPLVHEKRVESECCVDVVVSCQLQDSFPLFGFGGIDQDMGEVVFLALLEHVQSNGVQS